MKWFKLGITLGGVGLLFQACGSTGENLEQRLFNLFGIDTQPRLVTKHLSVEDFDSKIRGAWAGQMIGLSFASRYEFQAQGEIFTGELEAWDPNHISRALEKEDLYVQITLLQAVQNAGFTITSNEAAKHFKDTAYPLRMANLYARDNLNAGLQPDLSGLPQYNPYYASVTFQNQAPVFGIAAPGMPQTAVAMASNVGNLFAFQEGMDGGQYVTSLYSNAFFSDAPPQLVEQAMATLPAGSRYRNMLEDVLSFYQSQPQNWMGCWQMLQNRWADYEQSAYGQGNAINIEAVLNGGYITLSLLYGTGDFDSTLELAVRCGQDADSNAGIAAGVLGTLYGFRRIPSEYTAGLLFISDQPFLETEVNYNQAVQISKDFANNLFQIYGGKLQNLGDREYYLVPIQKPRPVGQG